MCFHIHATLLSFTYHRSRTAGAVSAKREPYTAGNCRVVESRMTLKRKKTRCNPGIEPSIDIIVLGTTDDGAIQPPIGTLLPPTNICRPRNGPPVAVSTKRKPKTVRNHRMQKLELQPGIDSSIEIIVLGRIDPKTTSHFIGTLLRPTRCRNRPRLQPGASARSANRKLAEIVERSNIVR